MSGIDQTTEELERALDLRDRLERFSHGRKKIQERWRDHSTQWEIHARAAILESPNRLFKLKPLAQDIAEWCRQNGIHMKSGKPYAAQTIYLHLLDRRDSLMTGTHVTTHRLIG